MSGGPFSSAHLWRQLCRQRLFVPALIILALVVIVALLAPILANNKPIYVLYQGQHLFPALTFKKVYHIALPGGPQLLAVEGTDWKSLSADRIVWPLIPYGPMESDFRSAGYMPPLFRPEGTPSARHWLGTGKRGNDLLAGLIHGARTSLNVALGSVAIAFLIGIGIGAIGGFFGDRQLRIRLIHLFAAIPALLLGWFYGFQTNLVAMLFPHLEQSPLLFYAKAGMMLAIAGIVLWSAHLLFHSSSLFQKKIPLPADTLLARLTEIVLALPLLYLLVTLAAMSRPSVWHVVIIIGLTGWTTIARLVRAELMRIRELDYIKAAYLLGLSPWRILWRHALPNAWAPALVSLAFGIGNVILAESALSFLGIGMPAELPSWGALISAGRENLQAWWLIVFPGLAIMLVVLCCNIVGEALRDALDPHYHGL
ncbi:MAG: ABC transporter permease [Chitinophagales bacterium]|nr:ABC transporter permease [Chitinophagales bacterium]MDW8427039.1 ABC transporter permease [Chitinophagales bacterium]